MAYSIVSAYDRDINTRVPELFYDLSEHVRASGSMTKALKRATSGNYGVISEEVWRVLSEIEHEGNSLAAALKAMAARVGNAYVTRSVSIINEAMTSSSDIEGVLKMVSAEGRLSRSLEAERRSGISQAVLVMYLTAFVFMIVVSLCITSFVPVSYQLSAMSAGEQYVPGNNYSSTMPYYALSISVAACSGVAIGVMRDMTVFAGFKDAAALVTIVFVLFRTVVFPGISLMEVFGL
jgi:flagellar protein FlaJ